MYKLILAAKMREREEEKKKWCTHSMCGYLIRVAPCASDRRVLDGAFFNSLYLFFQMESVVIFTMST